VAAILVVDDDRKTVDLIKLYLEHAGFDVRVAHDGERALELAGERAPDLMVLDLMLPKLDGLDVCRALQAINPVPVIMLTARTTEADKLAGLEYGADDYVTKPFSPRELLARARAVLRRSSQKAAAADRYSFGDVAVDFPKMELTRAGRPVPLTPQEFKILKYFAQNRERVISREELLNEVWGYNCYPSTRTVDNHILKLRQKLERDPADPVHFLTVHGAGYKFVP
jgi:DNA-binding response OmpR family regulator